MKITYSSPSQRRHYRLTVPLQVRVGSDAYESMDWSTAGLRFRSGGGVFQEGEIIDVSLSIPFQEFHVVVHLPARVRRVDMAGQTVAVEYVDPPPRARELLHYFSANLMRGEMADIDGTIKRLDMPITAPRPEAPVVPVGAAARAQEQRSWWSAGLYLVLGTVLAGYLSVQIYKGLFLVSSDHAMVYARTVDVKGPDDGFVSAVHVTEKQKVAEGEPLVSVRSPRLEQLLSEARQSLGELQVDRDRFAALVAQEQSTLAPYRQISQDRLVEAEAELLAARQSVELFERQRERMDSLKASGFVSTFEWDRVNTELQRARSTRDAAMAKLRIAKTAVAAAGRGSYYTADRLEGELPQLNSDLSAAGERVALAGQRVKELEEQVAALTLRAPVAGEVRQLTALPGEAVRNGERLVSLLVNQTPQIYALVPPRKLNRILLGNRASVQVPALSSRLRAEVVAIEPRTWTLPESLRQMLGDSGDQALVILALDERDGALEGMLPGLPVTVQFGRSAPAGQAHAQEQVARR